MKIALITPTPPDISSFGIRSLSAFLKSNGHIVKLILLPGGIDRLDVEGDYTYRYPYRIVNEIIDLCRDCDLVGFSFMTQYFDRAKQLSDAVRNQLKKPVVWGGVHPTLCPDEAIQLTDFVIEGEGEIPLLQLVQFLEGQLSWEKVSNAWRHHQGKIIPPSHFYWLDDISSLPDYDYSLDEHYVIDANTRSIAKMDEKLFAKILPRMPYFKERYITVYRTMSSRGCPHRCTYCINRTLREKYCTGKYLRIRPVDNVIKELKNIVKRFPFIEGIHFFDDTFFSNTIPNIEHFSELYKNEINLPFYCQGSPEAITEKKMELFLNAGMVFSEMGIQTGSEKVAKLYSRTSSNEQITKAIFTMDKYISRLIKPHYHVIVDNPWENTEDAIATIKSLMQIPHPFMLCLASLTLFPGTELNKKALKEGIINDPIKDVYRKAFYKPKPTYLNLVTTLIDHYYLPRFFIKLLILPPVIILFDRKSLNNFWVVLLKIDLLWRYFFKAWKAIRYGNFWRITQYFKKLRNSGNI